MLDLLCLSDLHLGERYSFLDRAHVGGDWKKYEKALTPLHRGIAELAGLTASDAPPVHVNTLVLLGDVFELATAKLATAACAGANFFSWLFQWLDTDEVVYIPGNHDHVFWMWWRTTADAAPEWWRRPTPEKDKDALASRYKDISEKYSDPHSPELAVDARQRDLIRLFFGPYSEGRRFRVGYPVYCGPDASPPGYSGRSFRTFFTHGHLNDPTFVRPADEDFVSLAMNVLSWGWGKKAKTGSLAELEGSTWKYTNTWWYPPGKDTTVGERLYLFSARFGDGNPCVHITQTPPIDYPAEIAPDVKHPTASANDFYSLLHAALGPQWYVEPQLLVYGHTHHGGALSLNPTVLICNTGGWLTQVKDKPVHTHLFAIDDRGMAQMKRVEFEK